MLGESVIKDSIIPKRYVGLVGLGLMYTWGAALVAWLDLWQSHHTGMKIIAFLGMALVSASGIAIALYTNDLEVKLKCLTERSQISESEAEYWKDQAQVTIGLLEKERSIRGTP